MRIRPKKIFVGLKNRMLEVIEELSNRKIVVRCNCGTEKEIHRSNFFNSASCGCFKESGESQMRGTRRESLTRRLLQEYKKGARTRRLTWTIADDAFLQITQQDCHYCGKAPFQIAKPRSPKNKEIFIWHTLK